jgi:hypothetical protein
MTDRERIEAQQRHEHYVKYEELAQKLGVDGLKQLVGSVVVSHLKELRKPMPPTALYVIEHLREAHAADRHLNTIPLRLWDAQHSLVQMRLHSHMRWRGVRRLGWALCETVCVLKHVAKHHVLCAEPPAKPEE